MLTLYARRHVDGTVTVHRAPEPSAPPVARYPEWHRLRPTRRICFVNLDRYRYRLRWAN